MRRLLERQPGVHRLTMPRACIGERTGNPGRPATLRRKDSRQASDGAGVDRSVRPKADMPPPRFHGGLAVALPSLSSGKPLLRQQFGAIFPKLAAVAKLHGLTLSIDSSFPGSCVTLERDSPLHVPLAAPSVPGNAARDEAEARAVAVMRQQAEEATRRQEAEARAAEEAARR